MRVPMKVDYGVRAMVELAHHYGERPMQTAEIAERQNIPEPYLDQLLTTLSKSGLIRSRRGPQGGHVLARPPADIALSMIVETLDGAGAPLDCIEEPHGCTLSSVCAQRDVWRTVEEVVHGLLRSTTIADLSNRQRARSARGMYQI